MALDMNAVSMLERAIDEKIAKAVKGGQSTHLATVTRVGSDGTTWVHVYGGADETPVRRMTSSAQVGDVISVTFSGLACTGVGNVSSPAATERQVQKVASDNAAAISAAMKGILEVNRLEAGYAHITDGLIDNAMISYADVYQLAANYAQIDGANVNTATIRTAWVEQLMVQTGLLAHTGTVWELDAIQLNADRIKAGTIDVDRLIVSVTEHGETHKYLVHVDTSGSTPVTTYEKLDGDVIEDYTITADKIVAHSITASEITTSNLVGTNGWINLNSGTFSYGTSSGDHISWDGTNLSISAASITTQITNDISSALSGMSLAALEYTPLEYVDVDGYTSFFTGVMPPDDYPITLEADFMLLEHESGKPGSSVGTLGIIGNFQIANNPAMYFGCHNGSPSYWTDYNKLFIGCGSTLVNLDGTTTELTKYHAVARFPDDSTLELAVNDNVYTQSSSNTLQTTTKTQFVVCNHVMGFSYTRPIRFYGGKIYFGDDMAAGLVPVKRNSDSAIGLYNIATDEFIPPKNALTPTQSSTATAGTETTWMSVFASRQDALSGRQDKAETLVRAYGDGVLVCKTGNSVGALVNADGSFDVVGVTWVNGVPTAGNAMSSFSGDAIRLGNGEDIPYEITRTYSSYDRTPTSSQGPEAATPYIGLPGTSAGYPAALYAFPVEDGVFLDSVTNVHTALNVMSAQSTDPESGTLIIDAGGSYGYNGEVPLPGYGYLVRYPHDGHFDDELEDRGLDPADFPFMYVAHIDYTSKLEAEIAAARASDSYFDSHFFGLGFGCSFSEEEPSSTAKTALAMRVGGRGTLPVYKYKTKPPESIVPASPSIVVTESGEAWLVTPDS